MKVAIQLYSVRNSMAKDAVGTIKKVVEEGYRYLEVANHNGLKDPGVGFGVSADEIKEILKDSNAKIVSAHIHPLDPDSIGPILDYHEKIGTKYIVYAMDFFPTYEYTKNLAIRLTELGKKCKERGISLLYHNHFQEVMEIDGEMVLDVLMENSDPEYLNLELDTFWALRGGHDPIELLKKYGKRVKLIHQKDYNRDLIDEINLAATFANNDTSLVSMDSFGHENNTDAFIEIGKGMMDIQAIIDTAKEYCDVEYIILEQDFTKLDEIESIKVSMTEFKKLKGISFE